ncbi:hypothetical protein MRB53_021773 [Persea americana]|uniref:Uncharacterized protein n=1 Tax=Persea americana TaxID=3435 RepID=A0ACC2L4M2_PERAE|nr:hypothetical protein MRB53_021773 [Persea americana]
MVFIPEVLMAKTERDVSLAKLAILSNYIYIFQVVEDNIPISLEKPCWLIALANMFVVIHVIGRYQIFTMPVFDMMETVLVKRLHFTPGLTLRLISRSIYVEMDQLHRGKKLTDH